MTRKKAGTRAPLAVAVAERAGPVKYRTNTESAPTSLAVPAALEQRKPVPGRPFPPGVSGNPAGRALGSRNKLSEDFLADMYRQYQESGPGILRAMATSPEMKDRVRFIELVHDLLPRHAALDVNVTPTLPRPLAEVTDADWEIALGIRVTRRGE